MIRILDKSEILIATVETRSRLWRWLAAQCPPEVFGKLRYDAAFESICECLNGYNYSVKFYLEFDK